MKIIEIRLTDLVKEKQDEVIEALGGEDGNYDVFPLAVLEFEEEGDEYEQ